MTPPHRPDSQLIPEAFNALLRALGPDSDRAASEYELLRLKLVKYFEWHGDPEPEHRADCALDRIARSLHAGTVIQNLQSFALGVARNLQLETSREWSRAKAALRELPARSGPACVPENRQRCMQSCLARLSGPERELIVEYYCGEGRARIDRRKRMAAEMKLPMNALRIRAHRIRAEVERCLNHCMENED